MTLKPSVVSRFDETAEVLESRELTDGVMHITVSTPSIAGHARPGQFIMLQPHTSNAPLLRRPMSLLEVDAEQGRLELLFRVVGEGTELMSRFEPGTRRRIVGPLGHGFELEGDYSQAILIGGGMGIPPLVHMSRLLRDAGKQVHFFYGARSKSEIFFRERIEGSNATLTIATDDGSEGHHGVVTEPWIKSIEEQSNSKSLRVFTCGPGGMLRHIIRLAQAQSLDTQVSLEIQMPCGMGICQGCAMPVIGDGPDGFVYELVCKDGPVFPVERLSLERMESVVL
jgi:dihydroorotate dehydrogenase electron transfer subunit